VSKGKRRSKDIEKIRKTGSEGQLKKSSHKKI